MGILPLLRVCKLIYNFLNGSLSYWHTPWILVYYVTSNHIVIFLEIPQLNFLGKYFGGFWLIRAQYRSIFIIVMWGGAGAKEDLYHISC